MKQDLKAKIENIISNENADENEILFHLKNLLEETELEKNSAKESKKISDLVSENLTLLRSGQKWENLIKTGFTDFDKSFGGFLEGELIVIGARPAMGKSLLLMNLALNISATIPLVYFTFDLSEFSLTNRIISAISKIEYTKVAINALSADENDRLSSIEKQIKTHNLFINDSCYNSMPNFKSLCKIHIQENGVRVIIVDCLQLMSSFKFRSNREAEVSYISRELKSFAKENNVCVIASSQLSRSSEYREGKRPQLTDLRESGAIEQYADKVIFVHRPEYYGITTDQDGNNIAGLAELILAKNRNGNVGEVKVRRNANFTSFEDFDGYKNDFKFSPSRLKEIESPSANDTPF